MTTQTEISTKPEQTHEWRTNPIAVEGPGMFDWFLKFLGFRKVNRGHVPPLPDVEAESIEDDVTEDTDGGTGEAVMMWEDEESEELEDLDDGVVALAELESPSSVVVEWEGDKPWDLGVAAESTDGNAIRVAIKDKLDELKEAAGESAVDKKFLARLSRVIDSDQLDLPPFPDIAQQLDDLLNDRSVNVVRIAKVVEKDPGLVRRVWSKASGAMYMTAPSSLHHAVARIGLDTLWRIGMNVCMHDTVFRIQEYQEDADEVRSHGIITAEVAAWMGNERRGSIYMAGLLHDVGKLIIYRTASGRKASDVPSRALVDAVCRETHAGLGVLVTHAWRLDQQVSAGVAFHHDPMVAPENAARTPRLVQAAHIAAHEALLRKNGIDAGGMEALRSLRGVIINPARTVQKALQVAEEIGLGPTSPAESPAE